MKETYDAYQDRIRQLVQNQACFPPTWEWLCTAPGLSKKFDQSGCFKPFYGDTTVFPLPTEIISSLAELQTALYNSTEEMLSEKLPQDTFHITLHDLSAQETKEAVASDLLEHKKIIPAMLDRIHQCGKVQLRSVGIVSMVSSSLVMLFEPKSESDHEVIQEVYHTIDEVFPLSYPLTLHCTLAYYKPGNYSPEQWHQLLEKVQTMNHDKCLEFEVECSILEYQRFYSMKEYYRD